MAQLLLFSALLGSLVIGFALLALSQDRNWRLLNVGPSPSSSAKVILRMVGYGLLALAMPFAVWRDSFGFGALMWRTMSSVAACAITLTLSWRPHWLTSLAYMICSVRLGAIDTTSYRSVSMLNGADERRINATERD